jgi:hypothetical protein
MLAEFFNLRNWRLFCLYLNNQRSSGKMEGTGRFTASNWSNTNPPRLSNYGLLVSYKRMKMCVPHCPDTKGHLQNVVAVLESICYINEVLES